MPEMHGTIEFWPLCALIGEGWTALICRGVVKGLAVDLLLVYFVAVIIIQSQRFCGRVHMRPMR